MSRKQKTAKKGGREKIGTWPTPEMPLWRGFVAIDTVPLPERTLRAQLGLMLESMLFKEVKFSTKLCKALEDSIRSDIGCLYKYRKANLCTEPKIKECLTRLVEAYLLYQSYCCKHK